MKTIVLTGMMGAGKSTIGKLLSEKYNIKYIDIDSTIEHLENMSIAKIFDLKGEYYFRTLEKNTITNIFKPCNMVISLGGGAFEDIETRKFLLENSNIIYLKTSPEIIYNRIKNDNSRPLLCNKMSIKTISTILNNRETNYKMANYIINTDNKHVDDIIMEIIGALKND